MLALPDYLLTHGAASKKNKWRRHQKNLARTYGFALERPRHSIEYEVHTNLVKVILSFNMNIGGMRGLRT